MSRGVVFRRLATDFWRFPLELGENLDSFSFGEARDAWEQTGAIETLICLPGCVFRVVVFVGVMIC